MKHSTKPDAASPGSRRNSSGEWTPVFGLVKDAVFALKLMPALAVLLAVLAWFYNHHNRTYVGPATAACSTCADR